MEFFREIFLFYIVRCGWMWLGGWGGSKEESSTRFSGSDPMLRLGRDGSPTLWSKREKILQLFGPTLSVKSQPT